MIPRYVHTSFHGSNFSTFIDDHFAYFSSESCSYPSTLDDDGDTTKLSLTILCVRLVFLIFFENAVYVAKIVLYASIAKVPHNIQLREELAQHVSQAVVAEVSDEEDDKSSSEEEDDLEAPAAPPADVAGASTRRSPSWVSQLAPSSARPPGPTASPLISVMSDEGGDSSAPAAVSPPIGAAGGGDLRGRSPEVRESAV